MGVRAHVPVMLREAVDALAVRPGGRYVDGTFGRGGHAAEIVRRGGSVLGIDRDDEALAAAEEMKCAALKVVKGDHGDIAAIAAREGWAPADGVILDLGVSSPQLDDPERGFSFMRDGPLDMRMDAAGGGPTAADVLEGADEAELERMFRDLGEEPQARRFARAIVAERAAGGRIETTRRLAEIAERAAGGRRGPKHPATRIFQALRMEVNGEIRALERALDGALGILAPGGRLAVIAFESLTDRIVKRFFAAHAGRMRSLQQGGEIWEGTLPRVKIALRKAARPSAEEVAANPRARSARLRAAEMEG